MSSQDKVALVIGMDQFQDPSLARLDSCKKDAQDMAKTLSNLGYAIYDNDPLIGSSLDKEYGYTKVRNSIVKFFSSATPSQTLLFYYSGHGIVWSDDVFLSTPQIDPNEPIAAGFSFSELTDVVKNSKSGRIVAIIDSCHAGALGLSDSKLKDSADANAHLALARYDQLSENVPKAEGKVFLLSSQGYQSSEALKNENSLYTKFLLEGLKGIKFEKDSKGRSIDYTGTVDDNGRITPQLLHEYVYNKVATMTNQIPKIKGDQSSKIVIAETGLVSDNVDADSKLSSSTSNSPVLAFTFDNPAIIETGKNGIDYGIIILVENTGNAQGYADVTITAKGAKVSFQPARIETFEENATIPVEVPVFHGYRPINYTLYALPEKDQFTLTLSVSKNNLSPSNQKIGLVFPMVLDYQRVNNTTFRKL